MKKQSARVSFFNAFDWKRILFIVLFAYSLYAAVQYLTIGQKNWDKSLVLLADRFVHGKISLEINNDLPIGDIADYKYNFYLYFGPFASLYLMPFVLAFGKHVPQFVIGISSMIVSFGAVFMLSKKFAYDSVDSL